MVSNEELLNVQYDKIDILVFLLDAGTDDLYNTCRLPPKLLLLPKCYHLLLFCLQLTNY